MNALLQLPMQQITLDSRSGVSRLSLQSTYYVKLFQGKGTRLKFYLGISRYQREVHNLQYFQKLGLNTPRLVAHGHESRWGRLSRAALVTLEVENALDLEKLLASGALYAAGVAGARKILAKLAKAARQLHADGFYHQDLKARNILVRTGDSEPELFFFDCPSGHHPPRFMLRRGIIRDLAHLEEDLRGHVRRVDLLYMYKQYRDCEKLAPCDKALARDVLAYYDQRRMTRKRRLREERKRQASAG